MNYPQQYPPQQQYPAQTLGYPPAQPSYPPQQQFPVQGYPPAQPGYPVQQQFPVQGYAPPPGPQAQPLAKGSLADFLGQPTVSGKSLGSFFRNHGQRIVVTVARTLTDADTQQQTDVNGNPLEFRDGRPRWVMLVPVQVPPGPEFPDGRATWYVKGQTQQALAAAQAQAGAPAGAPEAGAVIDITYTNDRPVPNRNAAKEFAIIYRRPDGSGAAPSQSQVPPQQQFAPQQQSQPPFAPPGAQSPYAAQAPAQAAPQQQYPSQPPPQQQFQQGASQQQYPAQPQQQQFEGQGFGQQPPAQQQYPAQPQQQYQGAPVQDPSQFQQGQQMPQQQMTGAPAQGQQMPQQQAAPMAPPPGMTAEHAAMLAQLTGQPPQQ